MQGLHRTSAHLWALQKARVRQPLLILFPCFVALRLGLFFRQVVQGAAPLLKIEVASGRGSRLADPHYAPSRASTEASATSGSTSNSNSDSSSNSDSGSSSDSDSDSFSNRDFDFDFDSD